jgi:hypothetical protein
VTLIEADSEVSAIGVYTNISDSKVNVDLNSE